MSKLTIGKENLESRENRGVSRLKGTIGTLYQCGLLFGKKKPRIQYFKSRQQEHPKGWGGGANLEKADRKQKLH